MKILHVEDSEFDAKAVRRVVERVIPNASVVHVKDVDAALQFLSDVANEDVGAILSDLNLPGKCGYDLASIVSKRQLGNGAAMIMITSDSSASARAHAFASGFDAFLEKPLSQTDFREALDRR